MSKFNEYLEMVTKDDSIEFDSYYDFEDWLSRGGTARGMKIIIPNEHGNKIIYKSILDARYAHEE